MAWAGGLLVHAAAEAVMTMVVVATAATVAASAEVTPGAAQVRSRLVGLSVVGIEGKGGVTIG